MSGIAGIGGGFATWIGAQGAGQAKPHPTGPSAPTLRPKPWLRVVPPAPEAPPGLPVIAGRRTTQTVLARIGNTLWKRALPLVGWLVATYDLSDGIADAVLASQERSLELYAQELMRNTTAAIEWHDNLRHMRACETTGRSTVSCNATLPYPDEPHWRGPRLKPQPLVTPPLSAQEIAELQAELERLERIRREQNGQLPPVGDEAITRYLVPGGSKYQVPGDVRLRRTVTVNSMQNGDTVVGTTGAVPANGTAATASTTDPEAAVPFDVAPFLNLSGMSPTFTQLLAILRTLHRRPSHLRRFFAAISEDELSSRWPQYPGTLIGQHVGPDKLVYGLHYVDGDPIGPRKGGQYFRIKGQLVDGEWRVITARGNRALEVAQTIHDLPPLRPVETALLAYQWNTQYRSPTPAQRVTVETLVAWLRNGGVARAWTLFHRIDPRNYPDAVNTRISLRGNPKGRDRNLAVTSLRLLTHSAAASEGPINWREGFALGLARGGGNRWVVRTANGQRALTLALAVQGWERDAISKAFLTAVWGTEYHATKPTEAVTPEAVLAFLRADGLTGVRADRVVIDPTLAQASHWHMRGVRQNAPNRMVGLRLLTDAETIVAGKADRSEFDLPLRWDGRRFLLGGMPTGCRASDVAAAMESRRETGD